MMLIKRLGALLGLFLLVANALAASPLEQQRQNYAAALDALRAKDMKRFQQLFERERGYLLAGYLEYEYLKDRIPGTSPEQLRRFLQDNKDAPVADLLRRKWLHYLAERGDWTTFLAEYRDPEDDTELRCKYVAHQFRAEPENAANVAAVRSLWLSGNKLPAVCEEMFTPWRKAGHLSDALVWERIKLAMERRNLSLAEHLATYLPVKERVWVQRWSAMHRDPGHELRRINYPVDSERARTIVRYGLMRLAQRDAQVAMDEWNRLKTKYDFTKADNDYVVRWVGLIAAQDHLPIAAEWLASVQPEPADEMLRHWRIRAAVRGGHWALANSFLHGLSDAEQREAQWRYWRARINEKLGREKDAQVLYEKLAGERGYYGFLAADHLHRPYAIQHIGVDVSPEEIGAMLARRGIQLAQELYTIGEVVPARRQWSYTIKTMNNRELQVAAVLAAQWGWYDRAILTMARTDNADDLELRFPILYRQMVEASAQANQIDPGWVYGIMRQESAFVTDARSQAGALGLMQLMPQTGRFTGRSLKLNIRSNEAILRIENNLRLGAHYLKLVLDQQQGHQVLATAAYNAGPNRLKEWLPHSEPMDADIWVDTIPFNETRNYVKNVLAFTTVYNHRLGNGGARLVQRMPPVAPNS